MRVKIVTIIGARPQFIKAAALSRVLRTEQGMQEILVHTGQHFDENMSDIFFRQMDIPQPDYNLGVAGLTHGAMTGRMLEKIESVLMTERPALVLVYGDTDSTLAGALAAVKLHVPVAHVEAGLRSFNRRMPEEINRVLTDHASDLLFAPTKAAMENLRAEGIPEERIHLLGDVMQDAAMYYADRAVKPESVPEQPFVLVTLHRAENTDNLRRLREIFNALSEISREVPIILPVHPRTRNKIVEAAIEVPDEAKMHITDPVGYLEMIWLLKNCALVLTDSGGLQKEANFFKKPCITLRDETEWVELVDAGVNALAGSDRRTIVKAFHKMQDASVIFPHDLYGGGRACERIVQALEGYLEAGGRWASELAPS